MERLLGMTASSSLEYRTCEFEVRINKSISGRRFVRGRAIMFDRWQTMKQRQPNSSRRLTLREKIISGAVRLPDLSEFDNPAFDADLRKRYNDVRALINHDPEKYLGSMFKRSLKLNKTSEALEFELAVPRTNAGNDLLAVMENEGGKIATSIGFKQRGASSHIKKVKATDEALDAALLTGGVVTGSAVGGDKEVVANPLDTVGLDLQEGRLDGSDYVESEGAVDGDEWKKWIVFKSLDLREISFLVGVEPAHSGVFAELGSGAPQPTSQDQARRNRELIMAEMRCLVG